LRRKGPGDRAERPPGPELARKIGPGSRGGRRHMCPYCGNLFELTVERRFTTITCPWCSTRVSIIR